jgi:hypothetical protein
MGAARPERAGVSEAAKTSSAGTCSTCGKHVEKRYGGEGRYLPECLACWLTPPEFKPPAPLDPSPPSA